jgi:hypothetical protein
VNLFQPSITLDKTGDDLSKIGDDVSYTVVISNTSSGDSPDLIIDTISDTLQGDLTNAANYDTSDCGASASGAGCTIEYTYTVQGGDPDPLLNTASVETHPDGFPNDIDASDGHSVNLFQPSYTLSCAAFVGETNVTDGFVTFGDNVCYKFTITNTSSADSPDLARVSASSNLLGDVTGDFPESLGTGASVEVPLYRIVQFGDPETLTHTITTVYSPSGFPNLLEQSASCTVTIKFGCMLSPGFWGGGEGVQKWDDEGLDPIAIGAGFYTGTPFPWVDPSVEDPTPGDGVITYLDIFNLPAHGDVTRQLSFKYVAARLNQALAAELGLPFPSALADLLDEIDAYLAAHPVGSSPTGQDRQDGRDLLVALNGYFADIGEDDCPATGDIPEYQP